MERRSNPEQPYGEGEDAAKNKNHPADKPLTPETIVLQTIAAIKSTLGDEADAWLQNEPDEEMLRKAETVEIFDIPEDRLERFTQVQNIAAAGIRRIMNTREYGYIITASDCSMGHKAPREKAMIQQFEQLHNLRSDFAQEANFYKPESAEN